MFPKVNIISAPDGNMSPKLMKPQYPVRLAVATTINKRQGPSLRE
jgi:hypothetical protein